jgi:hypothetical protein
MKDSRIGESLWFLWDLEESRDGSLLFYTEDHVNLEHEIVRKALASTLQREGISYSLGEAFKLIDRAEIIHGYSGVHPVGEEPGHPCDENGETENGYILYSVVETTWVKVNSVD